MNQCHILIAFKSFLSRQPRHTFNTMQYSLTRYPELLNAKTGTRAYGGSDIYGKFWVQHYHGWRHALRGPLHTKFL